MLTAVGACIACLALQWQGYLLAKLAHPADLFGRYADHQCVGFYIFVDHGTSADEGEFADGDPTHDSAVGAQGGAFFDQSVAVLILALDERARVVDVGEHHARTAEHSFFEGDVVVNRDVVLDFTVVSDNDSVADEDVLAE